MRTDPLADRIRERRLAMALSYRRLAALAGIHSPSFVFHIENGHKIPSEDVAARIARALGEDEDLYRAWSRVRRSGDLESSLSAARRLLRETSIDGSSWGWDGSRGSGDDAFSGEGTAGSTAAVVQAATPAAPGARLKVAVVGCGLDPGDRIHPSCAVQGHVRIDGSRLPAPERLVRPFAYSITAAFARRVPQLLPGRLALITRAFARPGSEVWAVRTASGVTLSRVLWNEQALLLQPPPGASDFEVIDAPNEAALRGLLVGWVAAQIDPADLEHR